MSRSCPLFRECLIGLALLISQARPVFAAWPADPQVNLPVCTAATNQNGPAIVADGDGGAIIAWEDNRNGIYTGIYAHRALASGAVDPAWPAEGRALRIGNTQLHPEMVTDGAGGAIVTWENGDIGGGIHAHHVLASGALDPAWPSDGLAVCVAQGNTVRPMIVADGSGGAVIAWRDYRNSEDFENPDVYAQHILASGAVDPGWPAEGLAMCTASGAQGNPRIVGDGAGGAVIVWGDGRTNTHDLYAHHALASGVTDPAWPVNGRALGIPAVPVGIAVVEDGVGGVLIAWPDYRSGTNYDMYAQHVMSTGNLDPAWPAGGRDLSTSTISQMHPQMVTDGWGGAVVTWEGNGGATGTDIFAQRVMAGGAVDPAWPADGRALCTAAGNQGNITIVPDGTGGAIVSWGTREASRTSTPITYSPAARRIPTGPSMAVLSVLPRNRNTALSSPRTATGALSWRGSTFAAARTTSSLPTSMLNEFRQTAISAGAL